jgi:hypothetical protein
VRSSWTFRTIAIIAALAVRPGLWAYVPAAAGLYVGALLWRYRFAREYATHRRGWWLVPVVKVTMDLGAEVGRWKALLAH